MNRLRYLVKAVLARRGLEIRRILTDDHVSSRHITDPLMAEYLPDRRGRTLLTASLADMRGLHVLGLPLTADRHPFVRAARDGLEAQTPDARRRAIGAVLAEHYATTAFGSALEAVALSRAEAPGLAGVPSIGALLPWSAEDPDRTIKGRGIAMEEIGHRYGRKLTIKDGITAFGPVSAAKLALETDRIDGIVASVKANGFAAADRSNPLKVVALRRDGAYRWLIVEGQHRLPVAAALGMTSVDVVVAMVIRAEDVAFWPQVATGCFSQAGAQKVFDRLFDAT